jgi:hypothetical protein
MRIRLANVIPAGVAFSLTIHHLLRQVSIKAIIFLQLQRAKLMSGLFA